VVNKLEIADTPISKPIEDGSIRKDQVIKHPFRDEKPRADIIDGDGLPYSSISERCLI
jgi:hypothetical protein